MKVIKRTALMLVGAICMGLIGDGLLHAYPALADSTGFCVNETTQSSPVQNFPALPECDTSRNLDIQIRNGSPGGSAASVNLTNSDALAMSWGALETQGLLYGFGNGGSWGRVHENNGELQVTDGGSTLTTASATTCTQIGSGAVTVHKIWAAGSETSTLGLYTDAACTTALYSKIPPNGTPDSLDAPVSALYYKMSAAAAVKDYVTTN